MILNTICKVLNNIFKLYLKLIYFIFIVLLIIIVKVIIIIYRFFLCSEYIYTYDSSI